MSKAKRNWQRRLRKIRVRARKLGKDSLLDLEYLDEVEKKTFQITPEDLALARILRNMRDLKVWP